MSGPSKSLPGPNRMPLGMARLAFATVCLMGALPVQASQPESAAPGGAVTGSGSTGQSVAKRITLDGAQPSQSSADESSLISARWRDAAAAVVLADLGLALLRAGSGRDSATPSPASGNEVWSPSALAAVLARLHDGTAGKANEEIAALVESSVARGQFFGTQLPGLLGRMDQAAPSVLKSANRLWIRADLYPSVPPAFVAGSARWPGADVALFPLGDVEVGRAAINDWVAQRTGQSIRELIRRGGITPTTQIALVSAVHFRSPWAQPFDASQTAPRSFQASGGVSMPPTMSAVRGVRKGLMADQGVEVLELPFADKQYALTIVMPAPGHSLTAIERRLSGIEWVSWGERLSDLSCRVRLPRFAIGGETRSLKPRLAALGVRSVFGPGADLGPMLGSVTSAATVDDLVQAAQVSIDEAGGEASAAAAVTVWAKSMPAPVPDCAVDRAFLFAITHGESRTPIFMGRVSDPSASLVAR